MKKLLILFLMLLPLAMASCGGDDKDEPKSTTNDPEGTILLNMYHDDDISLYPNHYLSITESNNFWILGNGRAKIVDVGKVNGISNIKSIPKSGWSEQTAILTGHGYIFGAASSTFNYEAFINNNFESYSRIYVVDFIKNTSGGIIGVTIKYQQNWKPE